MLTPKTNEGIATTRTGWFAMVALYLITAAIAAINEFIPDDIGIPTWAAPVVFGFLIGVLYRLSSLLTRYRWWGVVLFLINRAPGYADPPPDDPTPDEQPAPDGGRIDLETILVMIAIAVLVVACYAAFF